MSSSLEANEVLHKNVCSYATVKGVVGDNYVHLYHAIVRGTAQATHGPAIVENSTASKVKAIGEIYLENSSVDKLVLVVPNEMVGKITLINSCLIEGLIIIPEHTDKPANVKVCITRDDKSEALLLSYHNETYTVEELHPRTPSSPISPRK